MGEHLAGLAGINKGKIKDFREILQLGLEPSWALSTMVLTQGPSAGLGPFVNDSAFFLLLRLA
jgi:hypothetical protein